MATEMSLRVGRRIRQRRLELGIRTQRELADLIPSDSVTNQTVNKWETGANEPGPRYKAMLAEALEVDIAYFIAEEAKGETPTPFAHDDSDLATPAARDIITAMFESIEQRVINQLAEHSRKVEAQLTEQTRVLNEIKTLLGKDTETADRMESVTETLGGAAAQLDAQIQAILREPSPQAVPQRKTAAKRKTAPKRSSRP